VVRTRLLLTESTTLATTRAWLETPARAVLITFLCCNTSRLGLVVVVGVITISCLFRSSSFLCLTVGLEAVGVGGVVVVVVTGVAVAPA